MPASVSVAASGFSQATCLPASRAASVMSRCWLFGVVTSTRSISGSVTADSQSVVRMLPAPAVLENFQLLGITPADRLHDRLRRQIEEFVNFQIGVAVRRPMNFWPIRQMRIGGWFMPKGV